MISTVALIGNPNCGKTALFNALTGGRQKVANYPGVTVERKEGSYANPEGVKVKLLDLPGAYSLNAVTPDEEITRDIILARLKGEAVPDLYLAVADATSLERSLGLVLELCELKKPVVLALNMMDLAKDRGLVLDLEVLSRELGVAVVPTVAVKNQGLDLLISSVERTLEFSSEKTNSDSNLERSRWQPASQEKIRARFQRVDEILARSIKHVLSPSKYTDQIDRIVLHPVYGTVILFGFLALMFQAVFNWAAPFQDGIETAIGLMGSWVSDFLPAGPLQSLLVDGIISGVGAVLVFLPQILILFAFILVLEDSGYLSRAAFLMDRLMSKVGLNGKAFIPLLSSHACAIPGIMATRTIQSKTDRLATIAIAPLTTCSARLPVYTLIIGVFVPNIKIFGPLHAQGLVMFGLYVSGVVFALLVGYLLKITILTGDQPLFLLELPTYKMPSLRNLAIGLFERALIFVRRAGTVIMTLSILVWFLASYPKAPEGTTEPAIHHSFAGQFGHFIEPVMKPLGFDWRVATSMVPGFAAREVMVSSLATVYAIEAKDEDTKTASLGERLSKDWSLATALSLLVWYIFAPQCLSTFAVIRRETNSWRWTAFIFIYTLALAVMGSLITYQVVSRISGS